LWEIFWVDNIIITIITITITAIKLTFTLW